jgi:hypothetical protein
MRAACLLPDRETGKWLLRQWRSDEVPRTAACSWSKQTVLKNDQETGCLSVGCVHCMITVKNMYHNEPINSDNKKQISVENLTLSERKLKTIEPKLREQ